MNDHVALGKPQTSMKEFTILMAMMMSIVSISIDAMLPALGLISKDLQIVNPNYAQYIIGILFVGMAMGELVSGPLSDALGRKKILYSGVLLFLVGTVICYFADTLCPMLVGRFIQGIGIAGPYVSVMSIVRDRYAGNDMARVMSIIMMIFIMVPAIAPSLGQGVMLWLSWRYIFLLYIVYAIVITAWVFFRLEETLPKEKRMPLTVVKFIDEFKQVIGNRQTVGYTLCMGLSFGGFIGYLNSSQQIFQTHFNVGKMFTVYFGVLALFFGVSSLINSFFVERFGMQKICRYSFAAIIMISVLFLAVNMLIDPNLWMFLFYAGLVFFGFGLVYGNLNALMMEPMGHVAGMASAFNGFTTSIISMVLGTIIGQLYNDTLIPVISGFIIFSALALIAMQYAEKKD